MGGFAMSNNVNSAFNIFLGTPIQNSVKDLWMLLAFLRLKPFDVREWWNRVIQRPVTQGDRAGLQWAATHILLHPSNNSDFWQFRIYWSKKKKVLSPELFSCSKK